jgi:hypothetical protein
MDGSRGCKSALTGDALFFATKCGVDISRSINPSVLETNELEHGRFASSNP